MKSKVLIRFYSLVSLLLISMATFSNTLTDQKKLDVKRTENAEILVKAVNQNNLSRLRSVFSQKNSLLQDKELQTFIDLSKNFLGEIRFEGIGTRPAHVSKGEELVIASIHTNIATQIGRQYLLSGSNDKQVILQVSYPKGSDKAGLVSVDFYPFNK
ncbi:hypothetical protein H0A36_23245 [Endozoicomonas sp. SM1973]|uniref:Uncharacterized protein n=1 Tax=Spartinivicinus marinus TaxID=2994442 RepID=A0A853I4V8_9GAMM|nr:hypothetical protein [Spartinivicinus marinus]MCX4027757.1 hypothetical protein [Spartinivicinus marinus]NYZ68940.1 hypothetical protein [Spartinivicinus marinus]